MTDVISNFLVGVAQLLDTASAGVYDPDRLWTAADTETALVIEDMPQDPPNVTSLNAYATNDDPLLNDTIIALQVMHRGGRNPGVTRERDGIVFDTLQGLQGVTVGGLYVVLLSRQSTIPLGLDENERWMRSSNYYAQAAWPTTHRPD